MLAESTAYLLSAAFLSSRPSEGMPLAHTRLAPALPLTSDSDLSLLL